MAETSRLDRLESAIQARLANEPLSGMADAEIAALAALAAELRDIPREEFRRNLKDELQRSTNMSSAATETPKVKPIPEGYHTATPYLIVKGAASAVDFYRRAFGAVELFRMAQPDGRIGHAEIKIGDSHIMLADEHPEIGAHGPQHYGGTPVTLMLYVENVDAIFAQAVEAGAMVERPLQDQFYGDRNGGIIDPFGHRWFIATHIRDVPAEELQAGSQTAAEKAQPDWREGLRAVTPYLQVDGAARLIDFLKQAFGAEERMRVPAPDGKIMHADVKIGDSIVEMADASDEYRAMPTALHVYVRDVDAVYERALAAGGVSIYPPADHDYGERGAAIRDPLGNHWYPATHNGASFVPEGLHTVNLYLHPVRSVQVIEFLGRAFGAQEIRRFQSPEGAISHAEVRVGDSIIEMGDAHGVYETMPAAIHLHVPDADATFRQALDAGASEFFPLKDAPYGERVGGVTDPFGNIWYIATFTK